MIKTIIIVAISVTILTCLILFLLFYFGIIVSYHPLKKAKDNQIKVACVGDSITYGFMVRNWKKNNYPAKLNKLLGKNYCVNNFSYTNRTAIKSGDFPLTNEKIYNQSLDFKPDIVIILLGTNDSKKINWDKDNFINDYIEIINSYQTSSLNPKIYIMIPPPLFEVKEKVLYNLRSNVVINEIIPAIKHIAKTKGIECINLFETFKDKKELFVDGVHPNAKGSYIIAEKVFETLKKDLL